MYVISDLGDAIVNLDQAFAVIVMPGAESFSLRAYSDRTNVVLAAGSAQRVEEAAAAIREVLNLRGDLRPPMLDLRRRIGARPDLAVPEKQLLVPEGVETA